MYFSPNLLSCIIRFLFRIIDLDNYRFYFGFLSPRVQIYFYNLLMNFSTNPDPNQVIFDSVALSLSYLFKSIHFPNFSPQFIVQFDQIAKHLSKIP